MRLTWTSLKRTVAARTIGPALSVDLPLLGIEGLEAKVDTGAFNGALHAGRIREIVDKHGNRRLRFSPLNSSDRTIEIDTYHKRRVKSSNGQAASRYAIDTEIAIGGRSYPITLTLADRGFMKYQMLLGRNFLRRHGFLVDVNRTSR